MNYSGPIYTLINEIVALFNNKYDNGRNVIREKTHDGYWTVRQNSITIITVNEILPVFEYKVPANGLLNETDVYYLLTFICSLMNRFDAIHHVHCKLLSSFHNNVFVCEKCTKSSNLSLPPVRAFRVINNTEDNTQIVEYTSQNHEEQLQEYKKLIEEKDRKIAELTKNNLASYENERKLQRKIETDIGEFYDFLADSLNEYDNTRKSFNKFGDTLTFNPSSGSISNTPKQLLRNFLTIVPNILKDKIKANE